MSTKGITGPQFTVMIMESIIILFVNPDTGIGVLRDI